MKRTLLAFSLSLLVGAAHAQSVQQSGSVTPNTAAIWNSTGVIKGGVSATDSPLTTFGVTRDNADAICVSSARQSAVGRNQLCFQAATSGPAKITLQNYGTATAQDLQFVINGNAVTIPTGGSNFVQASGTLISGHMPCWSGTSGLVVDCGVGAGAGTQYGLAYYSAAGTISSTSVGTNGQFILGQTGAAPAWTTLSGDITSVAAGGAVVVGKVNGVTFPSSFSANGVIYASNSTTVSSVVSANVGYCLLSQGTSSPPIFASCASGSGSAGGSNTQVQFNNSTSLGGSANLTWVSPTLTIGVAGSTTGQLALASSTATGTVTLQAPGVASAYNFNFPTGAGSLGQPLISGGGGSTPNTFGTLGIVGGGTNCAVASGTCLDNITGFSSTGYITRTGSGTYAFSTVIPVSGGGTNLASGTSGGILGFTAAGTIASSALLPQNGIVIGGGAGATPTGLTACTNGQIVIGVTSAAPACQTLSGDITTVTSGGSVTIANSAISNAKLANAAAYTFKGNPTGSSAAPTDFTPGSLTQKASPAAGDYVVIADNAASGALKYATVSSIASAGSVSSIAGNTGAFTLSGLLTNSTNDLRVLAATQAEQETATSTTVAVTPGRQQYHPSAAKAWCRWSTAATGACISSYNVTSVTKSGTGTYVFNFTTAFSSSTAYACTVTTRNTGNNTFGELGTLTASTAQVFTILAGTSPGTSADPDEVMLMCYGDQ